MNEKGQPNSLQVKIQIPIVKLELLLILVTLTFTRNVVTRVRLGCLMHQNQNANKTYPIEMLS